MYWIYFILFTFTTANSLRGTYIQEREYIIQDYVYTYGMPIYMDILKKLDYNKKLRNYSFIEFGCIPFTEDMKNTEIIISKNNYKKQSIFIENDNEYKFHVYSCYSHFMALNFFKKERNMLYNKNNYIPNNEKYNHFKFYYYEELEKYEINTSEVQNAINEFLLNIFDDAILTSSYENCCNKYMLSW